MERYLAELLNECDYLLNQHLFSIKYLIAVREVKKTNTYSVHTRKRAREEGIPCPLEQPFTNDFLVKW